TGSWSEAGHPADNPRCAPGDRLHGAVRTAHRGPTAGRRHRYQLCLGRSRPRAVAIDRQELPGARHATQLDAAAVLETGARADDQVTHGARNEDLVGAGLPEDPRRDVDREPADVGAQQFAFACVDAYADLDAQCLGLSAQRLGAANGLSRAVERGEVPVAGALHDRAAESFGQFGCEIRAWSSTARHG